MYSTILVATDGSEQARAAVEDAVELAREHDATVHLLAVVDERVCGRPALGSAELVTAETADRFERALREARGQAEAAGIPVESTLTFGEPAARIRDHAASIDADLIVLGQHGDHRGRVGGVGRAVVEETDRAVRVVDRRRHARGG